MTNQQPNEIKGFKANLLMIAYVVGLWIFISLLGCTSAQTYAHHSNSDFTVPVYMEDVSFGCLEDQDVTHVKADNQ